MQINNSVQRFAIGKFQQQRVSFPIIVFAISQPQLNSSGYLPMNFLCSSFDVLLKTKIFHYVQNEQWMAISSEPLDISPFCTICNGQNGKQSVRLPPPFDHLLLEHNLPISFLIMWSSHILIFYFLFQLRLNLKNMAIG